MNPPNQNAAGRQTQEIFLRWYRGASSATKRKRAATAQLIGSRIWLRWQAGIYRWKQKHVAWYVQVHLGECTAHTRYQSFLVFRSLLEATDREQWLKHIDRRWVRPVNSKDLK